MSTAKSPVDQSGDEQLHKLLQDLRHFRTESEKTQQVLLKSWKPHIHSSEFLPSAANMAAYIGLRRQDIREIQSQLAAIGLSSLGRTEGHVLANLDAVIHALEALTGKPQQLKKILATAQTFSENGNDLAHRTQHLFGAAPRHRSVRIMVTFPGEAATDYTFVRELVQRGMDCARINCAHDSAEAWQKMIANVRRAEQETGRNCKVMMDLAGPKLRTGPVALDQSIVHLRPARNKRGVIIAPANVILDASGLQGCNASKDGLGRRLPARLGVALDWLQRLRQDDTIKFTDLRGKDGMLTVGERLSEFEVMASCESSAYFEENISLKHIAHSKHHPVFETFIGAIAATTMAILLREGDLLRLTREALPGEPAEIDEADNSIIPAHISCAQPAVLDHLQPGQRVLIDDGHISTAVESVDAEGALLRVTRAKALGSKLMAEKGLNFPDTDLDLPALTDKDLRDLDFVAAHADIAGYSFVQSAADMELLIGALAERNAGRLGIVAKIETKKGLHNLPEIIVRGAGRHPFGVMIARGDLAVEIGYEKLAETQEEIMWLCESAHVPVIWATQVLEGLVKENMPSRAEVTDAAMAERAECIMLNKGPFVLDAIDVLDHVVARMQSHQQKKSSRMRALHW
ncbi:MAG: pyruvate kinase [Nitrosomonadales bacterium]|nr:pyruvate kinase [Nitrosomonadales bacterium]